MSSATTYYRWYTFPELSGPLELERSEAAENQDEWTSKQKRRLEGLDEVHIVFDYCGEPRRVSLIH